MFELMMRNPGVKSKVGGMSTRKNKPVERGIVNGGMGTRKNKPVERGIVNEGMGTRKNKGHS